MKYRTFTSSPPQNSSDDLNVRLNYGLGGTSPGLRGQGARNSISIGFHYHGSNTDLTNPYPGVGGSTDVRSYDLPLSYTRTFGKLTNIMRADFNRSTTQTQNLYAYTQNIVGDLGINGVSQNPFDWGLPNLSFTNFGSLQDTNPLLLRNQTITFSDYLVWNHGKHTWRWGGDFRRIQLNTATDSNARGSFIFTGLNTSEMVNGQPVPGTGFDFADFLLGLPQQTSVQYGASSYYFRGNSWDLFAQDEWKIRGNLTINLGLRYEYVSPMTEINNRMVNLDVAPGFTAAVPVLPGQAGPYTGLFPATLVNPDRNNFAPRVGIAWKLGRNTVLRAGYGINYNTGAYQNIALQLAFQPDEIERAVTAAENYVDKQMTSADLVSVVSLGSSLQVNQDFTSDHGQLKKALKAFNAGSGQGYEEGSTGSTEGTPDTGQTFTVDDTEYNIFNTDRRLEALRSVAEKLSYISQRKSLIYFSSGVDRTGMRTSPSCVPPSTQPCDQSCNIFDGHPWAAGHCAGRRGTERQFARALHPIPAGYTECLRFQFLQPGNSGDSGRRHRAGGHFSTPMISAG